MDAQLKNSFQIYFELLHQIEVDCLHFSDGEIRNEGEKQESKRYCSFMDRNRNMEGIKNWQGIIELIEKPIDKQFTCISIDGMKVLCIHLFHFANIRGIKFTNFSMKHVELLIDASNIHILAAKEKVSYQNSSQGELKFRSLITILNKTGFYSVRQFAASYSITIRDEQVFK